MLVAATAVGDSGYQCGRNTHAQRSGGSYPAVGAWSGNSSDMRVMMASGAWAASLS